MSASRPILCTLTSGELENRDVAWRKVLASGLVRRERIPGGISLVAEAGAQEALTTLIDLERECCSWIDYASPEPGTFLLTAGGDGESVLAGMFKSGGEGPVAF